MAITIAFAGSEAVSTTEHSMPNDAAYTALSLRNDDGVFQLFLDVADMVDGDELQVRIYETARSGGTARVVYQQTICGKAGTFNKGWVFPALVLMHGWDMTLDAISGTMTVIWSIRKVA